MKFKFSSIILPLIFILIGLIAITLRFYINFSSDLIIGVNGAYYPLQVRHILQHGTLAFNDMPFLFYLNAAIIKIISLFGVAINDNLIINVVKVVDSIGLPMLLIPLYSLIKNANFKTPLVFRISIMAYSVLSFAPMILICDIQKNSLAIVFVFASIVSIINFLNNPSIRKVLWPIIWMTLTALTHFGTFSFFMSFVLILIFVVYKKKAIIPAIIIAAIGLSVIAIFDLSRFYRLITVLLVAFDMPMILFGVLAPPDIFMIMFSMILAGFGLIYLKKNSKIISATEKGIILASVLSLFILANPLLDMQFFMRLSLFIFIPQILILFYVSANIKPRKLIYISAFLLIITTISLLGSFKHQRTAVINSQEYADLKKIKQIINAEERNIICARHGLEWWTAWIVQTDVVHERAIEDAQPVNYSNTYYLVQRREHYPDGPAKQGHFPEPVIPEKTEIVYQSEFFVLYRLVEK
jgi:hypothetical protein